MKNKLLELKIENHENPTTLDYRPEFARPSGSGRIFRMPKIENSFIKRQTLDFTLFHPEFSIFVHKLMKSNHWKINDKKIQSIKNNPI